MKSLKKLIIELQDVHRKREVLLKKVLADGNRIGDTKRSCQELGKDISEYQDVIDILTSDYNSICQKEKLYLKKIGELAKQLPYADWYASFRNCKYEGYGQIIAETGDPRNYDLPAKMWKMMGSAVDNGRAHKNREKGKIGTYSKRKRSVLFRIANSIGMGKNYPGYYTEFYKRVKEKEISKNEEGGNADYIQRNWNDIIKQDWAKKSHNKKLLSENKLPPFILELRANRRTGKEVLKNIWKKWNPEKVIPDYEKQFEKEVV